MEAYLSYSCKGYRKEPTEFIINLHKLCFFHLKKSFKNIHFITDSSSKKFFNGIPWTSVSTGLDIVPDDYPEVWSLSKLYAYKEICEKGKPFIHVDNDVILWKPLPKRITNSEVFVQCPEDTHKHKYELEKYKKYCSNKSIFKNLPLTNIGYNMGIFGGTNLKFINQYADQVLKIILDKSNENFWKEYNGYKNIWCKAVLAEQYFLYLFSIVKKQKITCLFSKWPEEQEAIEIGYTHLMMAKNSNGIEFKVEHLLENFNQ
jgi:hypothetical protein